MFIKSLWIILLFSFQVRAEFIKLSEKGEIVVNESSKWACVHDTSTKLLWEIKTPSTLVNLNHSDAKQYVEKLIICGKSDWRLPTKTELLSLIDCPKGKDDWVHNFQCLNNYRVQGRSQDDGVDLNIIRSDLFINTGCADTGFGPGRDISQIASQPECSDLNATYWASDIWKGTGGAWYVNFRTGAQDYDALYTLRKVRAVADYTEKPIIKSVPDLPSIAIEGDRYRLKIPAFVAGSFIKSADLSIKFGDLSCSGLNTLVINDYRQ